MKQGEKKSVVIDACFLSHFVVFIIAQVMLFVKSFFKRICARQHWDSNPFGILAATLHHFSWNNYSIAYSYPEVNRKIVNYL